MIINNISRKYATAFREEINGKQGLLPAVVEQSLIFKGNRERLARDKQNYRDRFGAKSNSEDQDTLSDGRFHS
jgi:hypothetical protein